MHEKLLRRGVILFSLMLGWSVLHSVPIHAATDSVGYHQAVSNTDSATVEQSEQANAPGIREHEAAGDYLLWFFAVLVTGIILIGWLIAKREDEAAPSKAVASTIAKQQTKERASQRHSSKNNSGGLAKPPKKKKVQKNPSATPPAETKRPVRKKQPPPPTSEEQRPEPPAPEKESPSSGPQHIGYSPSLRFLQSEPYAYPVAKMPRPRSVVKFPRKGGRTGNRGFTEEAFEEHVREVFGESLRVFNDRRMVIASGQRPYEPDLVLTNEGEGRNLFIDIEIDEPYSGSTPPEPMHCRGDDLQRDRFFTRRGWIVIRFAEIQVHATPRACCRFIAEVIKSVWPQYRIPEALASVAAPDPVEQWTEEQAQQWAQERYREDYLGILYFGEQNESGLKVVESQTMAEVVAEGHVEYEPPARRKKQTREPKEELQHPRDAHIHLDAENHKYYIQSNPNVVSVTDLVQAFFPEFDAKRVSERIANSSRSSVPGSKYFEMSPEEIRALWERQGEAARQKGKALHNAIASTLMKDQANGQLPGMRHFAAFMRDHTAWAPYRVDWSIYDEDAMVAGTIDALFRDGKGRLVLCDWSRSKKIKRENDWESGYEPLKHMPNANYWHKALQLSMYSLILEKRYRCSVAAQYLVGLHPKHETYQRHQLPNLREEAEALLATRTKG